MEIKMNSKIILPAQFVVVHRFRKTFMTLLLALLVSPIVYGSESETPIKGCMTVRTLDESLSDKSQSSRERAKYRRMLRKCGLRPVSDSYDSLAELIDAEESDSLRVGFDKISFRNYPRIIGDNPAVSSGVPLTFDWDYKENQNEEYDIDYYEENRDLRLPYRELAIPKVVRDSLLQGYGYSYHQIALAFRSTRIAQNQRQQTISSLRYFKLQENLENCRRLTSCLFTIGQENPEHCLIEVGKQIDRQRAAQAGDDAQEEADQLEELIQSLKEAPEIFDEDCEYELNEIENSENKALEF